jgi:hypothetical protein
MQYTKKQQWIGGTEKEIVATDAKDATPISAVSYAINLTQYVRHNHPFVTMNLTSESSTCFMLRKTTLSSKSL